MLYPQTPALSSLVDDVLHSIFKFLAPTDIANLSTLSAALEHSASIYWMHVIKSLVSAYVHDVDIFIHLLENSGSVLSGSALFATLYREDWEPNDLDVYCTEAGFAEVVDHLQIAQGYTMLNSLPYGHSSGPDEQQNRQGYIDHLPIANVAKLCKGNLKIDVVQSANSSSLQPIALFWMTAVQCFATAKCVCIAHPSLNESKIALLAPYQLIGMRFPSTQALRRISKYEARGFRLCIQPDELANEATCSSDPCPTCPSRVRFFGDKHSLVLHAEPLATRAVGGIPEVLQKQNVYWWRGGHTCGKGCSPGGYKIWPGVLNKRTPCTL